MLWPPISDARRAAIELESFQPAAAAFSDAIYFLNSSHLGFWRCFAASFRFVKQHALRFSAAVIGLDYPLTIAPMPRRLVTGHFVSAISR